MLMPQHVNIDAWHTLNGFRHSRAHITSMHKGNKWLHVHHDATNFNGGILATTITTLATSILFLSFMHSPFA